MTTADDRTNDATSFLMWMDDGGRVGLFLHDCEGWLLVDKLSFRS